MCGRKLKNYDVYVSSIQIYAKSIRIKIERKEDDYDGRYVPWKNKIIVDPDLLDSTAIATLLHELGHHMDDKVLPYTPKIEWAYRKFYSHKYTLKHYYIVLACEKRAWLYGEAIAKNLNIKLGSWYYEEMRSALSTYRRYDAAT